MALFLYELLTLASLKASYSSLIMFTSLLIFYLPLNYNIHIALLLWSFCEFMSHSLAFLLYSYLFPLYNLSASKLIESSELGPVNMEETKKIILHIEKA